MNLKTLDKEKIHEAIAAMAKIIVDQFHPDKIILFGSHAKGDAGPDSDVDLLVVMRAPCAKRQKQIDIRLALRDIHMPKDIIVVTSDELEKYRNIVGTIIYPALREGKSLYERVA